MKLGMIGETIVNLMFTYDRIALPQDNTAVARIDTLVREGFINKRFGYHIAWTSKGSEIRLCMRTILL